MPATIVTQDLGGLHEECRREGTHCLSWLCSERPPEPRGQNSEERARRGGERIAVASTTKAVSLLTRTQLDKIDRFKSSSFWIANPSTFINMLWVVAQHSGLSLCSSCLQGDPILSTNQYEASRSGHCEPPTALHHHKWWVISDLPLCSSGLSHRGNTFGKRGGGDRDSRRRLEPKSLPM